MNGMFPTRPAPLPPPPGEVVKEFKGTGEPELRLPGCKSVTAVRVGDTDIPQYASNRFPVGQGDPQEYVIQEWPLWYLDTAQDGTPILRRSYQSNDGIWQNGVKIMVAGEFGQTQASKKAGE